MGQWVSHLSHWLCWKTHRAHFLSLGRWEDGQQESRLFVCHLSEQLSDRVLFSTLSDKSVYKAFSWRNSNSWAANGPKIMYCPLNLLLSYLQIHVLFEQCLVLTFNFVMVNSHAHAWLVQVINVHTFCRQTALFACVDLSVFAIWFDCLFVLWT